jgi:P pilus assembly chaperone PapD
MEHFTLPSVGEASKNGGIVHPFSQKPWPIPQTSKNKNLKIKIFGKKGNRVYRAKCRPAASD